MPTSDGMSGDDLQFFGAILTAQIGASQDASNRVLEAVQQDRDHVEDLFLSLYADILRASDESPVMLRGVEKALQRYSVNVDMIQNSRDIRNHGTPWERTPEGT